MFGALNRLISRLDESQQTTNTGDNACGFQVLRNIRPEVPLEPWFDFVIGINGHGIEPNPGLLITEIHNCAGSRVSLDVWTAKGQRTHTVSIAVSPEDPTLGVTLQMGPLSSTYNIWHVLDIPSPLSPAFVAGLLPHFDYILGTPSGTLQGESALGELVEDHLNRTLVLWVYNSEFDVIREVELVPRRGWGGEGALGAVLGFGALHRLPVGIGEEVEAPGEVVFDNDKASRCPTGSSATTAAPLHSEPTESHFLIPANLRPSVSPAPTKMAKGKKNKHRHGELPSFDDYFKESEQRSKEQDVGIPKSVSPVPPPPKIANHASPPPPPAQADDNEKTAASEE